MGKADPKVYDSDDPWCSMLIAVLHQAVTDVKELTELGAIRDGKCGFDPWPLRETKKGLIKKRFLNEYANASEVEELIEFFTGGDAKMLMELSGIHVPYEDAMEQLQLT